MTCSFFGRGGLCCWWRDEAPWTFKGERPPPVYYVNGENGFESKEFNLSGFPVERFGGDKGFSAVDGNTYFGKSTA
jgi:hypothetical protein